MTTHETERAQYAADVARLGPEAWRWWQVRSADWRKRGWRNWLPLGRSIDIWYDSEEYRRNPDTYPKEDGR